MPKHEIRHTVQFVVKEVLLGGRKAGEKFDYPTVAYNKFMITDLDQPATPWEFADLVAGRQFLVCAGRHTEMNKDLPGIHEVPLVLEETPSKVPTAMEPISPAESGRHSSSDGHPPVTAQGTGICAAQTFKAPMAFPHGLRKAHDSFLLSRLTERPTVKPSPNLSYAPTSTRMPAQIGSAVFAGHGDTHWHDY